MTEPLQTPASGTQQPAEVTPQEDLTEAEQLLAEAQERIEREAQDLLEPGAVVPEPPKDPAPQPQDPPKEPQTPEAPPATPQAPDYQEKFRQSSREAQTLIAKNNQSQARIEQLTNINITEDELRSIYPDWDSFNDLEKRAFRETAIANKKANQAMNIALDLSEERAWETDFARVLKANPKLIGREEDFKAYCYKPAHKNVSIDVLIKSFLYDLPQDPAPTPPQTPGLEKGSGGPRGGSDNGELSEEQLGLLRTSNPEAYRKAIQAKIRKEQRK